MPIQSQSVFGLIGIPYVLVCHYKCGFESREFTSESNSEPSTLHVKLWETCLKIFLGQLLMRCEVQQLCFGLYESTSLMGVVYYFVRFGCFRNKQLVKWSILQEQRVQQHKIVVCSIYEGNGYMVTPNISALTEGDS